MGVEVAPGNPPAEQAAESFIVAAPAGGDASAWRDELSGKLNRYRARRKVRPPRYPSLALKFETPEPAANLSSRSGVSSSPVFESVSNHALALDGMRQQSSVVEESEVEFQQPSVEESSGPSGHSSGASEARLSGAKVSGASVSRAGGAGAKVSGGKIIEFPRYAWAPPLPPPDQLAEPVTERPRILDVPDVAPPAPALGGITIEAVAQPEAEKRPGIDIPLQSAPLERRLVAALVDGLIIATASAIFGYIFWKVAAVRPPLAQMLGLAAGIPALFWAAYQYLLVVYAANTPGLRVAGLELARFDGSIPFRSLRRWRVLASWLSAVSAGMGYVWVFLDEDELCWHDRITHTYLAPKGSASTKPKGANSDGLGQAS
jgi:uncharacterized RDD family membrane protein YckC